MSGLCAGRVVIVTGAGRGIGRGHALEFARQGASVVVNDVEVEPAAAVVTEIEAAGGTAHAAVDDASEWEAAERLVAVTLDRFGRLDVVVNNAGILRDRMVVSMTAEDWDAVMRVHLGSTFCLTHHAAAHWRELAKGGTSLPDARVINTSSGAGLQGSVGQANYSAAKAGIAAFTLVAAAELGRYGVTVNAIAPAARTRMTEDTFTEMMAKPATGFDAMDAENVAPLVVWLGSTESAGVTGRVFEVAGGKVSVAQGWMPGPEVDKGARWDPAELGPVVRDLLAKAAPPAPVYGTAS